MWTPATIDLLHNNLCANLCLPLKPSFLISTRLLQLSVQLWGWHQVVVCFSLLPFWSFLLEMLVQVLTPMHPPVGELMPRMRSPGRVSSYSEYLVVFLAQLYACRWGLMKSLQCCSSLSSRVLSILKPVTALWRLYDVVCTFSAPISKHSSLIMWDSKSLPWSVWRQFCQRALSTVLAFRSYVCTENFVRCQ